MILSNREKHGLFIVVIMLLAVCILGEVISTVLLKNIEAEQNILSNRSSDVIGAYLSIKKEILL